MNYIVFVIYILIPTIALLVIRKRNGVSEQNFILKWIGYYMLGALSFAFNEMVIPLGFLIYFLYLRPKSKENGGLKGTAAMLGLTFFFVQLASPTIEANVFQRPHEIQGEQENIYEFSFQEPWELVSKEFGISTSDVKLNRYKITYQKDGSISEMSFEIVRKDQDKFVHYDINYSSSNQTYIVSRHRTDSWLQYNRLIDVTYYFSKIDDFPFKSITNKYDYAQYKINGKGEKGSYSLKDHPNYILNQNSLQKVSNSDLPIDGYLIHVLGKETDSLKRESLAYCFFDVSFE